MYRPSPSMAILWFHSQVLVISARKLPNDCGAVALWLVAPGCEAAWVAG